MYFSVHLGERKKTKNGAICLVALSCFFGSGSLFGQSNCQKQSVSAASLLRLWQLLTIRTAIGSKLRFFSFLSLSLSWDRASVRRARGRLEGGAGAGRHSRRGYTSSLLLLECGSESREPKPGRGLASGLCGCMFSFFNGCWVFPRRTIYAHRKKQTKKKPKVLLYPALYEPGEHRLNQIWVKNTTTTFKH